MNHTKRRVVVTGLGVVSSIGIGITDFWQNLIQGKSGISRVGSIDTSRYRNLMGGEVKTFDPSLFIKKEHLTKYGRGSQFAIAATKLAIQDARIVLQGIDPSRIAVVTGTTMANIRELEEINRDWVFKGEDDIDSRLISKYPGNNVAFNVAEELGIRSTCMVIPTACAAGNYCVGYGHDLIKLGRFDIIICGGTDPFSRISFTGFHNLFAMAPEKCQPFDKNRKGMMVGEGAGVLILESSSSALKRGADIYAEILGYGLSCDATHMTLPDSIGIEAAMKRAIHDSGIDSEDIDYVNAHGTGTKANDSAESHAIKSVFGTRNRRVPVSSIKSMLGHTMGAASAIEAVACSMTVKKNLIPPTINFNAFDPECDIDCVPNHARQTEVKIALNNSFAFGGNNACLVVSKFEG